MMSSNPDWIPNAEDRKRARERTERVKKKKEKANERKLVEEIAVLEKIIEKSKGESRVAESILRNTRSTAINALAILRLTECVKKLIEKGGK